MSDSRGTAIIRENTVLKGDISNCQELEVFGVVEGRVAAGMLRVHPGGKVNGIVKVESAEIDGTVEGDISVKHLIRIGGSGSVTGNVRYGRLSMAEGAELSARVRNIPPSISGDLEIAVQKGRSVRVMDQDLAAVDPDDAAAALTFTVTNVTRGAVILDDNPGQAVTSFTQADLNRGAVRFAHDGSDAAVASFDVAVTDAAGATSGAPQTVTVAVYTRAA